MCHILDLFVLLTDLVTNVFRPIFVSREDPNSRQRASEEIRRRAEAAGSWPSVLIFPEGNDRNKPDCMQLN